MKFSLVICTYMRPKSLTDLLDSVKSQEVYPNEIIIVDGSRDHLTKEALSKRDDKNLTYYSVEDKDRGLTRQRNFGISKVSSEVDIVCFLDDDTILESSYFEQLIGAYKLYPGAGGIGGYITNEVKWRKLEQNEKPSHKEYESQGWVRGLGSRNVLRKKLGLLSNKPPGFMPEFSNGFSVGFLPPTDKVYKVEYFMGGVSSFRKQVVDTIKFSTYFEGYGLYEDLEYCLRVSKEYPLYLNTKARLGHYHAVSGRPNQYSYGKMVVRNGWLVWRTRYPNPSLKARFKWNIIMLLLMSIRLLNVLTTSKRKEALTEAVGRKIGWLSLLLSKPLKV